MVYHASVPGSGGREIDTIVAVATPPGKGAVAIVRVSGPEAFLIASNLVGELPEPRVAGLRSFYGQDGEVIDRGLVLTFKSPHSYTGEDVVEFQGHGGTAVVSAVINELCSHGARPASRGEFTERAFLNGQLELSQAEAVAALIDAESQVARKAALRSLEGRFGERIDYLSDLIIELRTQIEADLDFSEDEEITSLDGYEVRDRLLNIQNELAVTIDSSKLGAKLRAGFQVVLMGRPNVGKSKLMNSLAGREVSIVTDTEGTTRDLIRDRLELDSQHIEVVDTAGIRSVEATDAIEREGVKRAKDVIGKSDIAVLVVDITVGFTEDEVAIINELNDQRLIVACNKKDLVDLDNIDINFKGIDIDSSCITFVSAETGQGIDELRDLLAELVSGTDGEDLFAAEERHLFALSECKSLIDYVITLANEENAGLEVIAEVLRQAQSPLREITGKGTNEDVLAGIFSKFCIGK